MEAGGATSGARRAGWGQSRGRCLEPRESLREFDWSLISGDAPTGGPQVTNQIGRARYIISSGDAEMVVRRLDGA